MAEGATRNEHAAEDRDRPAAARDEGDETAQARRARQMALIDGIVRDCEPVQRELGRR
jgi:hypothetical protein